MMKKMLLINAICLVILCILIILCGPHQYQTIKGIGLGVGYAVETFLKVYGLDFGVVKIPWQAIACIIVILLMLYLITSLRIIIEGRKKHIMRITLAVALLSCMLILSVGFALQQREYIRYIYQPFTDDAVTSIKILQTDKNVMRVSDLENGEIPIHINKKVVNIINQPIDEPILTSSPIIVVIYKNNVLFKNYYWITAFYQNRDKLYTSQFQPKEELVNGGLLVRIK